MFVFPGGLDCKASVYNAGDLSSITGSGRFPGEGNGNPLQYSCLENPMDGGAWCPWGHKESDTTERLHFLSFFLCYAPSGTSLSIPSPTLPPTPLGCLLPGSVCCPRVSLATTIPWWLGNSGPGNPPTLSHLVLLFSQEVHGICLPIKPPDRHGHAEKGQMGSTPPQ